MSELTAATFAQKNPGATIFAHHESG